jgi:hypothetical protein
VVLTPPETPDESTGTNADAIARLSGLDHVLSLPREGDPSAAAIHIAPVLGWLENPAR